MKRARSNRFHLRNLARQSATILCAALAAAGCATNDKVSALPVAPLPAMPFYSEKHRMVDVRAHAPAVIIDLRYGGSDNVAGRPLYPHDMPCLLYYGTARKLKIAQAILARQGYGLKIWDAYRPPEAQRLLYAAAPTGEWVTNPDYLFSQHSNGTAVDVTLVDAAGGEQRMPTGFDEFSTEAGFLYRGQDAEVKKNLYILQSAMGEAGFFAARDEWWHFNDIITPGARVAFASELNIKVPKE